MYYLEEKKKPKKPDKQKAKSARGRTGVCGCCWFTPRTQTHPVSDLNTSMYTHFKHRLFSEISSNAGAVTRALTQRPLVPVMPIPAYGTVLLLFIPKPCSLGKSKWSEHLSSKQLMWTEASVKVDQASSERLGKWTHLLWVLGCFGDGQVAMERASLR